MNLKQMNLPMILSASRDYSNFKSKTPLRNVFDFLNNLKGFVDVVLLNMDDIA